MNNNQKELISESEFFRMWKFTYQKRLSENYKNALSFAEQENIPKEFVKSYENYCKVVYQECPFLVEENIN